MRIWPFVNWNKVLVTGCRVWKIRLSAAHSQLDDFLTGARLWVCPAAARAWELWNLSEDPLSWHCSFTFGGYKTHGGNNRIFRSVCFCGSEKMCAAWSQASKIKTGVKRKKVSEWLCNSLQYYKAVFVFLFFKMTNPYMHLRLSKPDVGIRSARLQCFLQMLKRRPRWFLFHPTTWKILQNPCYLIVFFSLFSSSCRCCNLASRVEV